MYLFIINPIAGHGRAKRAFHKISSSPLYQEIKKLIYYTAYEGHAEEIVHEIFLERKKRIKGIIVIGGDGTLHEVMNGFNKKEVPVTFIPGGSGNDFARGFSIIKNPLDIFEQAICSKSVRPYWLGQYTMYPNPSTERFFVNNIGFGFDAQVAQTANETFYKRIFNTLKLSKLSYIIALIQVIFRFKPMNVVIEIDGKKRSIRDCWMVTISNHPFYGGGMKINPEATVQPEKFSVLILHSISKLKVLSLFLTVFSGAHVNFKEVDIIETTNIHITTEHEDGLRMQVDGEIGTCKSCSIGKQSAPIWINGAKQQT